LKNRVFPQKKRTRLICSEIFESMSILADGSVTCGCVDIYEGRILGNVKEEPLRAIFDNEKYRDLRRRMLSGDLPPQCVDCPLRVRSKNGTESIKAGDIKWLQIDPAFNCNLRCPDCAFTQMREENYFIRPRTAISLETFRSIIDQAAPTLQHIRYHMLGEPFLNKQAGEMLRYAREKIPSVFISIETNGTLVGPDMQKQLVDARVDYVKFSIDGASRETYGEYRRGGDFEQVFRNMKELVETRNKAGSDRPRVLWQYILFRWNDSDREIRKAQMLAREAGVDDLYWLLTHSAGASRRFVPGESYPIFEGEGQSLNVTIEIASREGRPITRPAPTLEQYDPWK